MNTRLLFFASSVCVLLGLSVITGCQGLPADLINPEQLIEDLSTNPNDANTIIQGQLEEIDQALTQLTWYVAYHLENGVANVYVYLAEDADFIPPPYDTVEVTLSGDKAAINALLKEQLAADNAKLGSIDGWQDIIEQ